MEEQNRTKRFQQMGKSIYDRFGILIVLMAMVILLSIFLDSFLTASNILNILKQIACLGILACGVCKVIIVGGLDLSVGSIVSLSSVLAASCAHPDSYPVIVPVLVGVGTGFLCGAANGIFVAKLKIPPFIVTMSSMTIFAGIALVFTKARPINGFSRSFNYIGGGKIQDVPVPIYILVLVTAISWFVMKKCRIGYHICAVGGNENAARLAGVHTDRVKIFAYAYSGMMAGLAGVVLTSRVQSGLSNLGTGMEMDAIAAVVIGGTSLAGGTGSVLLTIIGACVIGVINNGMDLMMVDMYWQDIVSGIIILLAVLIDNLRNRGRE
ncbi:MAG: ABC transporter permease [Ruminococcus sp.]|nr:ABC transporter permease [Ruminococcus sp.]